MALSYSAIAAEPASKKPSPQVERGRFLVTVGGCHDCHTPMTFDPELGMPVPDMSKMLSGHPEGAPDPASTLVKPDMAIISGTFTAFALPFGIVYSPNLTSDTETGIGNWTEKMFVTALKTGKHLGGSGRPILPPMPWQTLSQLPEADLKAMFAYLRTVPPIKNGVPSVKVPEEAMQQIAEGYKKMAERMKGAPAGKPPAKK
jgi:hypothetical protein